MKVLFFADLHGDMLTLESLRKRAENADIVVCAGDVSQMEMNIREVMEGINRFEKPVLMIHGNHENEQGLRELCEEYDNITFLHKGVHHLDDAVFMGYGGDGFSTNDPDFLRVAENFFKPESEGKTRKILVTHGPPHGTEIDNINGSFKGNKSYRKFIDEVQPHIAVAGHLHETAGVQDKIGKTLVLNPGKKGIMVEL